MYYKLEDYYGKEDVSGLDFATIMAEPDELDDVYWTTGVPIRKKIPSPVTIVLSEDDGGPDMPDYFGDSSPACSRKMLGALESVGIDNIELFDLILSNPVTGKSYSNYKMMNLLGSVQAADMEKSSFDSRSEMFMIEFKEIVIDSKKAKGLDMFRLAENADYIIISEKVKESLEQAELTGMKFLPLTSS